MKVAEVATLILPCIAKTAETPARASCGPDADHAPPHPVPALWQEARITRIGGVQNIQRLTAGECWQEHGLIFASNWGTPINPNNFSREWARLIKLAGMRHLRIHGTRCTHITWCVLSGMDLLSIQNRVGHEDTALILKNYAKVGRRRDGEIAKLMGEKITPFRGRDQMKSAQS